MRVWLKILAVTYREQQQALIQELNDRAQDGSYPATFIAPNEDYRQDPRVSLGVFLIPPPDFIARLHYELQLPLLAADPAQYGTPARAMHFTFKNIQTVADPPTFTPEQALQIVDELRPLLARYPAFVLDCEGLLVTPSSIGLVGYYPQFIGEMVRDISEMLVRVGVPDNKRYISNEVTFTNITLVRYRRPPEPALLARVADLQSVKMELPVTSLQLVSADLSFRPEKTVIWDDFPLQGTA